MTKPATYADAGVDIDAANRATEKIKELARTTFNARTLSDIGSFGGMFDGAFPNMRQPVLVASADGVGTKLKIAFATGIHNTIGRDLVNHCVNDILVQGARPLFFLDYIATGRLSPETIASIIEGITAGCRENGCVLLGGETAEMPGFYADGEYDVAGFIVGVVEREQLIDGRSVTPGDVLIGIPSSGRNTNGYSPARRIVFDRLRLDVRDRVPELGTTIGDALLAPHRSYLPLIRPLLPQRRIKAMAHITGGGITDNLPRVLGSGAEAIVRIGAWEVPPIFRWLGAAGAVPQEDMLRTFNMGIGLILVVARTDVDAVVDALAAAGEPSARAIGEIVAGGEPRVRYLPA